MRRIYLLAISLIFAINTNLLAQQPDGLLELKGTVKLERKGLSGAKIDIFDKGRLINTHTCDKNGKFKFEIELNKEYILLVKKVGFYGKRLYINTHVPKEDFGLWSYKFAVELLTIVEGFDASLLETPIGRIKFVDDFGDFDYDEDYTKKMQKKLANMMREYEKKKKEQYKQLIAQADDDFNQGNYDNALIYYEKAALLNPYDPYPDDQISTIKRLMEKDKDKQSSYDKAIAEADKLFKEKNYKDAKLHYKRALKYFDKQYPKDQITFIDNYFDNIAQSEADAKALEGAYKDRIATADRYYRAKDYNNAMVKYSEAQKIKPKERYPKDQIQKIQDLLASIEKEKQLVASTNKRYSDAITSADAAFKQLKYEQAKSLYTQALNLKPNEKYPKQQIATIDKFLAAQKSTKEKYDKLIAEGNQSFLAENYEFAKNSFQKALSIKPNEAYPKQKIDEINKLLANIAQKKKQDIENSYKEAITKADNFFNKKDYEQAKTYYTQAVTIKSTEIYPKDRLAEISKILDEQATLRKTYDKVLAKADNAFNNEKWEDAKILYTKALEYFPNEQYPQTRLQDVELKLLAMKNEKEKLAAMEKMYSDALAKADNHFNQEQYTEAKNFYQQALKIKPDKKYPKKRLAEVENLLTAMAEKQQKYNAKIQEAQSLFASKNYNGAISAYKKASSIKPNEQLPKQKINEIQQLIQQIAQNQHRFDELMTNADNAFANKNYIEAKGLYEQASQIKPDKKYPKSQIEKLNKLIAEQKELLAKQQAKLNQYKAQIAKADQLLKSQKYEDAISAYLDAKQIKPDETYPDQQIQQINALIKAQNDKLEANYQKALLAGDTFANSKQYDKARSSYQKALSIKPNDAVARGKITDLDNLIQRNKLAQAQKAEQEAKFNEFKTKADQFFKKNDFVSALAMYKNALGIKPNDSYSKQRKGLCEKKIKQIQLLADQEAAKKRQKQADKAAKSFNKKDFDYKGEKRNRDFLNALAKQYPNGKTVENYNKPNKKIKRIIINKNGIAKEYIEVKYSYGTFYFRNGQNISRSIFNSETN